MGILVLFGGCLAALLAPGYQGGIVIASFVGYVAFTRRALALCHADDLVFESKPVAASERAAREALRAGLLDGTAGALSLARPIEARRRPARSGSSPFPRPVVGGR
jgi:uncharacterized membrane protein YedE/YeeE